MRFKSRHVVVLLALIVAITVPLQCLLTVAAAPTSELEIEQPSAAIQMPPIEPVAPGSPALPDPDDYTYSQIVTVTNNSGAEVTDPLVEVPVIPYEGIEVGNWEVTLGNGTAYTYNYAIPCSVIELSNTTLTNYEFKIGPVDTKWLYDNSWSTQDGNETVFVPSADLDGSIAYTDLCDFWVELDGTDWDSDLDQYFWVEGNMTAWGDDTFYMLIDPDLTTVTNTYASTRHCLTEANLNDYLFDFFDPMDDGDNWINMAGSASYSGGICTVRNGTDPEYIATLYAMTPDGTGTYTQIASANPAVAHYLNMDDPVDSPDDNSSYIYNTNADQKDSYTLSAPPSCSTVNSVTVYFRIKWSPSFPGGTVAPILVLSGSTTTGTAKDCNGIWTTHSETLSRPGGGSWTAADLTDLEAGVRIVSPAGKAALATQVYVVVDCDSYGEDHAFRARVNMPDADGNGIGEGAEFGFGTADRATRIHFNNKSGSSFDEAAQNDNGASVTTEDDQYPYVEGSYAIWDIIRRDDHSDQNRSVFTKFLCDNVQLTDAPIWTNVPTDDLGLYFWSDDEDLLVDWVLVRDNVSPEPICNIPQIHHDPDTIFLNDGCENWPYDVFFTLEGNDTALYHDIANTTKASEYATAFTVKYIGTLANSASGNITIHYGNAAQTTPTDAWSPANVWEFYDSWNDGTEDGWAETSGTWELSNQQRPEVIDYHLMNVDDDISAIYAGTPIWTNNDGVECFIAFVGSWAGTTSNNQGSPQWMIPWEVVLYQKNGNVWYREANVLTGEYDEFTHASSIPMKVWWGDDSYMGDADYLYLLLGTTTIESTDQASWIYRSDDDGYTWEALNNGAPFADSTCVNEAAGQGRFSDLVYDDGYYYIGMQTAAGGWDIDYLYGNDTDIKWMLYGNATITPADVWTDGGEIVSEYDDGEHHFFEESYWIQKDDGNWTIYSDSLTDRTPAYFNCDGDDFGITMTNAEWTNGADVEDLDTIYQWSYDYIHDFHVIELDDDEWIGAYGAMPGEEMEATKTTGFAESITGAGTSWTNQNIDYERYSSTGAADWETSTVNGGNYTSGEIRTEVTIEASDGIGYAGIIWRYQDDDNFCTWLINSIDDKVSYGIRSGGSWSGVTSYDTGEEIWPGERYELAVIFDGATTTLKYRKLGWKWTTAYTDVDMSDGNVANYGSAGTINYATPAYFDDFSISDNEIDDMGTEGAGGLTVDTTAVTPDDGSGTQTLNGDITGGPGAATIGFVCSTSTIATTSGSPADWHGGSASTWAGGKWYYTTNDDAPYGIDSYSKEISGLATGTYYVKFLAQGDAYPAEWEWGDEVSFEVASGIRAYLRNFIIIGPF